MTELTDKHRDDLRELAEFDINDYNLEKVFPVTDLDLLILHKAREAINKKNERGMLIWLMPDSVKVGFQLEVCHTFLFSEHNNSEQQALTEAFIYILDKKESLDGN